MKNYEKYADEIKEYNGENFCIDFVLPNIMESNDCSGDCSRCRMLQVMWMLEDYKEPEVDWSKVEVDTPILVRNGEGEVWERRHFAEYKCGVVCAWNDGLTSWSECKNGFTEWKFAKLAESEEE